MKKTPTLFFRTSFALLFALLLSARLSAQSGNEFWLAPPEVTDLHNPPGGEPLYLLVSSTGPAATVTVTQPANPGFNGGTPIVVNVPAGRSRRINLTAFKNVLETRPTNTVLNTGLRIQSTTNITAYYEVSNTNNTDIWALKGPNGLGQEFYIPLHKHAPFFNHNTFAAPHQALATFDVVATQNNTVVTIYSPVPLDGHPALTQFSVTLNAGQTYSSGWSGANYDQPANHPSGAVVLADKPIAVSIKDDSNHNPSGGCYDLMGDQLVPVSVVGEDYIAVKGSLNNTGDESVVITATQNNTQIFLDGSPTPVITLFAGEYYRVDMDYLAPGPNNAVYIHATKPVYAVHVTGFGCESGEALLPPLNCAGSQSVNFVRSTAEGFFVTLLVRTPAVNSFTITGPGTATINPASFLVVPGTGGTWRAARIQYNTTQVPVDSTFTVTNSTDVFALGIINGGAATGCRYGYFSEFVAPIAVNAGPNQTVCANSTATLAGSVAGGTTTGIWTSTGTGAFTPNNTTLNATYTPSAADASLGSVTLTLTSTGACTPQQDQMVLTVSPAPTANAGPDQTKCANNASVSLNGAVTVATGGQWSGGAGTFIPNNTTLNATYTPTAGEISSGSITLTLTTTGNGICNAVNDNIVITFTPAPTVSAGADQTKCGNNAATTLNGSVTVATGGVWTGGTGAFNPSNTALNAIYTPSPAEISAGSVTLTLTTTGNGTCNAVTDQMTIFFTLPPIANAGPDQTKCANNAATTLAASVTGATGGQWSGGLGVFSPSNTALNATYTPTAGEISSGSVTLTLTTTGNGTCNAVTDQITISFTPAPTANAGPDQTKCANNAATTLAGSFTVATGALWSGAGTFTPNNTTMNAVYTPTAAQITAGTATVTLTTTGNGTCNPVVDQMVITITPAPTANAGPDQTKCANNAATTLAGAFTVATGGVWSGGAGSFSPNTTTMGATYTPTAAEISAGSVTLTLTTTGNGTCNAVTDQMTIFFTPAPTANAGADQTKCANNAVTTLAGAVTGSTGGQWSGGLGVFAPNSNTLNATYTPTAAEISAGSVTLTLTTTGNGTCNAVTDQMTISFTPAPTANAGVDQTVCANNPATTLNGSFTIATGAQWSGAGTFTPNNTTMNAVYTPTAAQIAAGTATVTLTTTGNGTCNAVVDQMVITITPAPTANAGPDQSKCANNPATTLNGSFTVATGGVWSGGAGSFSPNTTTMGATYTPTAGEISSGSVTLTLTTTGNGTCNAVSDQMIITFTPAPTANAGPDQTKCANNAITTMAGSVTGSTGGQWSGGLGVFTPNSNTLNATYTPTAAELAAGSVTLTLTTTGNGTCNAVTDQMTIFFTPAPTASAGPDQSVCANNAATTLAGAFTVSGGAVWTGGTGTFNPNNTTMNAVYTPSAAEISAGTVTLMLTTTGNGTCNPASDQMTITITSAPIVNAGADISSCANNPAAQLNGTVFNASGGQWSGGGGTFNPNSTTLNAIYTPTAAEISAGSVTLTLTSTGNGGCIAVTDQVIINFAPAPISNAGSNQTVCANNATVTLNGFVNFSAGGQWSGGLGAFSPSSNALNATYTPTAGEIASGSLNLILTTTGNGSCLPVSDTMTITFTPAPTANAGSNQTSCSNNVSVTLNGSFTVGAGAIWTGGTGSFSPNNTTMNAVYTPSAAEIAAGTVQLTLTTTGNGTCNAAADSMTLTIVPAPTVSAGPDQTTCVTDLTIPLSGSVSGMTNTGQWTTLGSGTFTPSNTTLNATYNASAADSTNGSVTLILASTNNGSCNPVFDTMTIAILPAGGASAGADQTVCANNASVSLNGSVSGGATSGVWSTTGTGIFLPNNNTLNATYVPSAFDIAQGSATLFLTANSCNPAVDSLNVTITPAPVVSAGPDQTVCASTPNATLNGSVSGGTTTGVWTTSGSGTFSPSNSALNATYNPSPADISAQNIVLILTSTNNGSCVPVSDTMLLNIYPTGTANAGPDQIICANNANVALSGAIGGGATSGQWTTSGTGTFLPNDTTLNATYVPSVNDIASGSVNLVLTATNSCNNAIDFMNVTFTPAPIVNAGPNQSICGGSPVISLSGSVANATGGVWTGGGGSFNPNNTTLNASYTPTASEIANGGVILTLTSTGNGNCNAVSDTVFFALTSSILVSAGSDQQVCITSTFTQLQGIVSNGSTTGVWSTLGSGTFSPNDSALNALYTYSTADTAAGSITLVLTSTNNGNCPVETDTMTITFGPSAYAFAGNDQMVCADNAVVQLNGLATGGATMGVWTTSGTGTFSPNDSVLNPTYTFSAGDLSAGSVTLYIATTDHGSCLPGYDSMLVSVTPVSSVSAGGNVTVCSDNMNVSLNGSVSGSSTTGQWTSTGSGTFSPDNQTLNATYIPSTTDSLNGTVMLILTSTGTGVCGSASDTITVTITPFAMVSAGADQSVCASGATVPLSGSVSGGSTTGQWSTLGSGTFTPSATTLNATYTPSATDLATGTVTLVLTSTNNGICSPRTDTMIVTFQQVATVVAGNDFVICGSEDQVQLGGLVSGSSTTGIWTTTGTGAFAPNATTLNATYTLSAADIASGSLQLFLTSTNNGLCPATADTLTITIEPDPVAAFIYDDSAPPQVVFTDQSTGAATWYWTFGDGGSSTSQNPTHPYETAGDYDVTLIITSAGGCSDTTSTQITVEQTKPVAIPTGFTPNADGKNDVLHVLGGPFKEVTFKIFNEWGNEVFATTDPAIGWDGTYKGKPQPGGVYIYTVVGTTVEDKAVKLSGNVTLLR